MGQSQSFSATWMPQNHEGCCPTDQPAYGTWLSYLSHWHVLIWQHFLLDKRSFCNRLQRENLSCWISDHECGNATFRLFWNQPLPNGMSQGRKRFSIPIFSFDLLPSGNPSWPGKHLALCLLRHTLQKQDSFALSPTLWWVTGGGELFPYHPTPVKRGKFTKQC